MLTHEDEGKILAIMFNVGIWVFFAALKATSTSNFTGSNLKLWQLEA